METDDVFSRLVIEPQFKSYYVVWKLLKLKVTNNSGVSFKSYYVVWKHKGISAVTKSPAVV